MLKTYTLNGPGPGHQIVHIPDFNRIPYLFSVPLLVKNRVTKLLAMQNTKLISLLLIVILLTVKNSSAQDSECKVLMPAISGIYSGECKKGLAQGQGISQGVDHYEGQFSKGLPHGKGTYTWADGSVYIGEYEKGLKNGEGVMVKDTATTKGFWKNDVYVGAELIRPYEVIRKDNLLNCSFRKTRPEGNQVIVKLLSKGQINPRVSNLIMASNYGTQFNSGSYYGFENTYYPFNLKISYTTSNPISLASFDVVFECIINEPGTWEVILNN
jgi:hypothetical protein